MVLRNARRYYLLGLITSIRNVILSSFSLSTVLSPSAAGATAPGSLAIAGQGCAGGAPAGGTRGIGTPGGGTRGWGGGCVTLAGALGAAPVGPGAPTPPGSDSGST